MIQNPLPDARAVYLAGSPEPQNVGIREFERITLGELLPLVGLPSWIGKQSYEGRWWFSRSGKHVAFASGWERDVITVLDFTGRTAELQRDAVIVLPPYVQGAPPRAPHQPWLCAESTDHERVLILNRSDFDRARELEEFLSDTQIRVATPTLPSIDEMRVIRWLAGYRFSRYRLQSDIELIIRDTCLVAQPLGAAVRACATASGIEDSVVRGNIYSQLWWGYLKLVEFGHLLDDHAEVAVA